MASVPEPSGGSAEELSRLVDQDLLAKDEEACVKGDKLSLTPPHRQGYLVDVEAVSVADLVDAVRQQAPGAGLDRGEAALTVSEELASCADELIGQFVEEARRAGCSWTEIGQRIGVSKQAARERFADPRRRAPQSVRLSAPAAG